MKPASLHEDSWEETRAEEASAEQKASSATAKEAKESPAAEFEMAVDAVEGQEPAEKEG